MGSRQESISVVGEALSLSWFTLDGDGFKVCIQSDLEVRQEKVELVFSESGES